VAVVAEDVAAVRPEAADSPEVLWATPSAPSKRFHGEALLWMGIHRRRWGKVALHDATWLQCLPTFG
jgi:hypothetical protein